MAPSIPAIAQTIENEIEATRSRIAAGHEARLQLIAPETFALTKRQIRGPVLDHLAAGVAEDDREVERIWRLPSTRAAIEAFVESTLKR